MSKPTISIDNIKWADLDRFDPTSGQANKAIPSTDKINYGWESSETPPMGYFNYWQNLVYQYINWLASDRNDTIFLNGATSDATETELFIDGVDEDRLEIADNSNILFDCLVNAFSIGNKQSKTLRVSGEIQRIDIPKIIYQNKEVLSQTVFDVSTAVYNSEHKDMSSVEAFPKGVSFNTDGSKMFVIGATHNDVFAYDLSTNFDVSTAVYDSETFDIGSLEYDVTALAFNTDGSKMFITGVNGYVYAYDLSTNFDVSTAVYNSENLHTFGLITVGNLPDFIAFNTDGSKIYLGASEDIYALNLSTNFDVSTAVYNSETFDASSECGQLNGLTFNTDGSKMFVSDNTNDSVFAYDLSTNFDVSTAVYNSETFDASDEGTVVTGIRFNTEGSKMFLTNSSTVYAYDLITAWDINLEADTINNALVAKVTGVASTNINWKVRLEKIENS